MATMKESIYRHVAAYVHERWRKYSVRLCVCARVQERACMFTEGNKGARGQSLLEALSPLFGFNTLPCSAHSANVSYHFPPLGTRSCLMPFEQPQTFLERVTVPEKIKRRVGGGNRKL